MGIIQNWRILCGNIYPTKSTLYKRFIFPFDKDFLSLLNNVFPDKIWTRWLHPRQKHFTNWKPILIDEPIFIISYNSLTFFLSSKPSRITHGQKLQFEILIEVTPLQQTLLRGSVTNRWFIIKPHSITIQRFRERLWQNNAVVKCNHSLDSHTVTKNLSGGSRVVKKIREEKSQTNAIAWKDFF